MAPKLKTAIIGVGVMGKKYAEMISGGQVENMTLAAMVVRRDELLPWAKSLNGSPRIYRNTDELFANPDDYDAVLIVTPHKTHPELAHKAFALGKHVLCDKPAGVTVSDAASMSEDANRAGKIYGMIFHQRRYEKYRRLKSIIENNELGDLKRIMLVNSRYFRTRHYHKSGTWRSSWTGEGGGALLNQGQHIIDIWQWLFGLPEKIYADIPFGKYNDFMVDDEATITMRYPNNLTAVFMLTTGEAVREDSLEIIGTKGKILLEEDTLHIWRYTDKNKTPIDVTDYAKTQQVTSRENMDFNEEVITFDKKPEPYIDMLSNFAEAVLTNNSSILYAPGSEALNPLMITNAAYLSAWKGSPVALPISPNEYQEELARHILSEKNSHKGC
jgi:predicted dehydrogenase